MPRKHLWLSRHATLRPWAHGRNCLQIPGVSVARGFDGLVLPIASVAPARASVAFTVGVLSRLVSDLRWLR